jgi:UDP-N-acetylmuramoylalanine--D-glutamate ligase
VETCVEFSTLPLLRKVKEGDILVCELDSWQLQGFGESKISPHISVFTSFMPDHMNYYKDSMKKYFYDKANIYRYQKRRRCFNRK